MAERVVRELVRERSEPPGKAHGLPDAAQAAFRVPVDVFAAAGAVILRQCPIEHPDIGCGEVQTLGARGRHDVRGIAHQK